jgi:hypothetical protein
VPITRDDRSLSVSAHLYCRCSIGEDETARFRSGMESLCFCKSIERMAHVALGDDVGPITNEILDVLLYEYHGYSTSGA